MHPAFLHDMRTLRPTIAAVAIAGVLAGAGVAAEPERAASAAAPALLAAASERDAGPASSARRPATPSERASSRGDRGELALLGASGRKIG